jgi:hypothetical protein
MQYLLLIIIFKIALTVLVVTLGAMFIAEFFPMLADQAVASSSGSPFEPVGKGVAYALNFVARYAAILVDLIFNWLQAFGIDIDRSAVQSGVRDVNLDAPKNIEKPEF